MFDTKNNILKISNTSAFIPYTIIKKTINIKDVIMKINVDENGKIKIRNNIHDLLLLN
jgi:hypothetical protein